MTSSVLICDRVCEKAAVGVLNECHARDKQMTHQLLVRHLPQFGGTTVFRLAKSYDMMDFTEHSACQTKLSSIWKGRMASDTPEMKVGCVFRHRYKLLNGIDLGSGSKTTDISCIHRLPNSITRYEILVTIYLNRIFCIHNLYRLEVL